MVKHRHDAMKEKYPDTPTRKGLLFEGLLNLRPESLVYQETIRKTQNMGK